MDGFENTPTDLALRDADDLFVHTNNFVDRRRFGNKAAKRKFYKRQSSFTPDFKPSALPRASMRLTLLGGSQTDFDVVPDSGAQVSVTGSFLLHKLGIDKDNLLPPPPHSIRGAQSAPIVCIGMLPVRLDLGERMLHEKLLVCQGVTDSYLSWRACVALRLLSVDFPRQCDETQVAAVTHSSFTSQNCHASPTMAYRRPSRKPTSR